MALCENSKSSYRALHYTVQVEFEINRTSDTDLMLRYKGLKILFVVCSSDVPQCTEIVRMRNIKSFFFLL